MNEANSHDETTDKKEEPGGQKIIERQENIDLLTEDQTKEDFSQWDIFGEKHTYHEADKIFQEAEDLSVWSFWKI